MKFPSYARFLPLFFSTPSVAEPLDRVSDWGLTGDQKVKTFSLSDAMKLLDEIKGAKSEKEALVKLSQLLIAYFEHNNINQTRLKHRLDRHEYSNKFAFILVGLSVIFTGSIITVLIGMHMGAI